MADAPPPAPPPRALDTGGTPMTGQDNRHPATTPAPPARPGSAAHRSAGHGWVGLVLGTALVVMALVAGLNFTFAVAVMPNLAGVVLAITGGLHIPLNEQISQAGAPDQIAGLAHLRDRVEGPWVNGNLVRALFCTAAVAALARALFLHGHRPIPSREAAPDQTTCGQQL